MTYTGGFEAFLGRSSAQYDGAIVGTLGKFLIQASEFSMRALPTLNGLIGAITVIVWVLLLTGTKVHKVRDNTFDDLRPELPNASQPYQRKALSKLVEATTAEPRPPPDDGLVQSAREIDRASSLGDAVHTPETYTGDAAVSEGPRIVAIDPEARSSNEAAAERSASSTADAVPQAPLSSQALQPAVDGAASPEMASRPEAAANAPALGEPSGMPPGNRGFFSKGGERSEWTAPAPADAVPQGPLTPATPRPVVADIPAPDASLSMPPLSMPSLPGPAPSPRRRVPAANQDAVGSDEPGAQVRLNGRLVRKRFSGAVVTQARAPVRLRTESMPAAADDCGAPARCGPFGWTVNGDRREKTHNREAQTGAGASAAMMASLNRPQGAPWRLALKRRCPSIMASADAYDDDLVRLCRLSGGLN